VRLRDRLKSEPGAPQAPDLYSRFGVTANPFPASSQTSNNPHLSSPADGEAMTRILSFLRDKKSQVVVIEGTQGVGKTNFLNYFESDIQEALSDLPGYYVVRYLADPEASFEGTIRRLFQELGTDHIVRLSRRLNEDPTPIDVCRGHDMRTALLSISQSPDDQELAKLFMEWLLGLRVLKIHRERLEVQFRLDTVESKTAALRDLVLVSSKAQVLEGIFLLLDELEKQDGVLGPTAVVRYLSAMRAIIDALPNHLFMMIAVTPDAMRRYSAALPAFRSRLQNQITLAPLSDVDQARELASFYLENAKAEGRRLRGTARTGKSELVTDDRIVEVFEELRRVAERRGDPGVRQREFLHRLYKIAEETIQNAI
jgi:hypothetical protein